MVARPSAWVVGHLTVDDVVFPDGRTTMGTVGGAAIYAAAGARLVGLTTGIITRQGADYPASAAEALGASHVPLQRAHVAGHALSQWAIYEHDGTRTYLLHPDSGDYRDTSPQPQDGIDWDPVGALHLAPMPLRFQRPWLDAARERGVTTLTLDPHHDSSAEEPDAVLETLPSLGAFLPSELESERLYGDDHEAAAEAYVARGVTIAIVKLGPEGSILASRDGRWHLSACPVEPVDTTGAGDAYAGALVAALGRGDEPLAAARLGTVAAALTIGQSGALTPLGRMTRDRVDDLLASVEITPM